MKLNAQGTIPDLIIMLERPDELVREFSMGRCTDATTGVIYHPKVRLLLCFLGFALARSSSRGRRRISFLGLVDVVLQRYHLKRVFLVIVRGAPSRGFGMERMPENTAACFSAMAAGVCLRGGRLLQTTLPHMDGAF